MEYDGVGTNYSQQVPQVQEVPQSAFPKKDLANSLKQEAMAPISLEILSMKMILCHFCHKVSLSEYMHISMNT